MLDTLFNFALTALMVIVGPALLAVALAYGIFKSGSRSRAMEKQTDGAAKRLYREGSDQERRGREPLS